MNYWETMVTHQGPEGKEVKRLYIEQGCDIQKRILCWFRN